MGAWKGRSEAIMVDYHTAVETVRNPHADPVMLARIAYKNPEFGANVAAPLLVDIFDAIDPQPGSQPELWKTAL